MDLPQLERLGRQQQDAVLSLAESSGLVVKRATRQTSTGAGGPGGSLANVDSSSRPAGGGGGGSASVDGFTQVRGRRTEGEKRNREGFEMGSKSGSCNVGYE